MRRAGELAAKTQTLRLLGRVEVGGDDHQPIPGAKVRTFLVAMLLQPNQLVGLDRLTDVLWDDEPPRSWLPNLRSYAHRVRDALGRHAELAAREGGYQLRVPPTACDHVCFAELAEAGREALKAGQLHRAADRFAAALLLWRADRAAVGVARQGLLVGPLNHLDDERLRVLEDLAAVSLEIGEPRAALREAHRALTASSVRTRSWALVLRAHHRLGEPARLVDAYEQARSVFRHELGMEPEPELRQLYQRLLPRD